MSSVGFDSELSREWDDLKTYSPRTNYGKFQASSCERETEGKTNVMYREKVATRHGGNFDARFELKAEFPPGKKPDYSFNVNVGVQDDYGNKLRGKIEQDADKTRRIVISGEHNKNFGRK